ATSPDAVTNRGDTSPQLCVDERSRPGDHTIEIFDADERHLATARLAPSRCEPLALERPYLRLRVGHAEAALVVSPFETRRVVVSIEDAMLIARAEPHSDADERWSRTWTDALRGSVFSIDACRPEAADAIRSEAARSPAAAADLIVTYWTARMQADCESDAVAREMAAWTQTIS